MALGRRHSRGSFVHDIKGFAGDVEVAKILKAVGEMANNVNLGVDGDVEELLEGLPEELTNGEVLELDQECITGRGRRKGN